MKQPSTRTPARRRRLFLPALGLVVIGGVVAVQTLLPTAGLRDDLVTSVEHQTGRSLTVHDISLRILPWPMVVAHDVTLSGTRAAPLFTAHELRARIAFLPLFARHLTLRDVVAQGAALTLERGTDGVANWHFTQPDRPSDTADPSHPAASPTRWDVRVASLQIAGGTVRWDDAAHHLSGHATLDHAAFAGLDGPAPTLDIAGHHQDGGFTLRGQTGALAPLFWPGGAASPDWPVHLIATVTPPRQDADLVRLDGTLDGVGSGTPGGYRVSLSGTLHHLRDLNSLFPRAHLPDVATVGLDVGLHGTADAPHIDHLHLSTGAARFGSVTLAGVEIGAQTPDAPLAVRLDQVAASDAAPAMTVRGTLGTIAGLEAVWQARGLNGLGAPLSVALTGQGAGDTTLHVQGVVGAGATALDLSAHAGHVPLVTGWALDNAVTSARLEAQPDHTLTLSNLKLESRQAIIDGQVALGWSGPRPSVNATVHATRIDVDDMKTPAPPAAEPSTQPRPTGSAATAGSHATDGQADAPRADWLRRVDLALVLSVDHLNAGGSDFDGLAATLHTTGGDTPAGTLALSPVVVPGPLLAHWLGLPVLFDGPVMLVGQLAAQGQDRASMLRTVSGHVGASIVGGRVEGAHLRPLLGGPAAMLFGHGDPEVRCLGAHMAIDQGMLDFDALGLQAGRLGLSGTGRVTMANGALDLHLVPHVGLGGAGASTPVAVGGTLDAPVARMAPDASDGRFRVTIGSDEPDPCPGILAAAREGLPGPAAAAESRHGGKLSDMLRGLGLVH